MFKKQLIIFFYENQLLADVS